MTDFTLDPAYIRRRSNRRALALALALVVVVLVGFGALLWAGVTSLGKAVGQGVLTAVYESGASYGVQATNVAYVEGVSPGNLTLAELQARQPLAQWLAGNVAVAGYRQGTKNQVSVAPAGDHITTATAPFAPGYCSYGLVVTSDSDPVVAADGLPGTGTFATVGASGSPCAADQAPTSGWTRVPASDVSHMGISVPPALG
jgi:hypothetical protein